MRIFFGVVLAFSAVVLGGCNHPAPAQSNAIELHTYEVPKGSVRPLMTTLKDVFYVDEKTPPVGRATITPDGELMVVAPHDVQPGVQNLVDQITKHPPTTDPAIELRYWILRARATTARTPITADLQEIAPALEEISRLQGPQAFTTLQRVRVSSLPDEWGRADADGLDVQQRAAQASDGVVASVEVHFGKNDKVETRVRVMPGQTIVLAATGQSSGDAPDAGSDATLYYLIRAAPPADGKQP